MYRAVALLGSEAEQGKNAAVLGENNFLALPLRNDSVQDLETFLSSGICGVVVAGSYWEAKSPAKQESDLKVICGSSSILFVRIDETNLAPSASIALTEIQKGAMGPESKSWRFCRGKGCEITASDLSAMSDLVELLDASESLSLASDDISHEESQLLKMVAVSTVRGRVLRGGRATGRLGVKFLGGGKSGAKIAVLRPDDGGSPLVAKLHEAKFLQEEVRRYNEHIRRWDPRISPELHYHFGAFLILYNLVEDAMAPDAPAPTLDDRLESLLLSEVGWRDRVPLEENLEIAIGRAIKKLYELNRRKVNRGVCLNSSTVDWMISNLREMAGMGIKWNFSGLNLTSDPLQRVPIWHEQIKILDGCATVHGDVHLKNVLLHDDRLPIFIDFEQSGPGHPCYDLVRLGSAITYKVFRMVVGEDEVGELFRRVIVHGLAYDDVVKDFSAVCSSPANRIAIKSLIMVRAACLDVLGHYGGDIKDYIAMQAFVACFSLTMPFLQVGVVRSMIRSLLLES